MHQSLSGAVSSLIPWFVMLQVSNGTYDKIFSHLSSALTYYVVQSAERDSHL